MAAIILRSRCPSMTSGHCLRRPIGRWNVGSASMSKEMGPGSILLPASGCITVRRRLRKRRGPAVWITERFDETVGAVYDRAFFLESTKYAVIEGVNE